MVDTTGKKRIQKLTCRQELALFYFKKDGFKSMARALRKAGYSEAVARQPNKVFHSPAVERELFFNGLGDKITKRKQNGGKTITEWKVEELEEAKAREATSRWFQGIISNPAQIALLKKRLIEEGGYDPYVNQLPKQIEIPSHVPISEGTHTPVNKNFSSM